MHHSVWKQLILAHGWSTAEANGAYTRWYLGKRRAVGTYRSRPRAVETAQHESGGFELNAAARAAHTNPCRAGVVMLDSPPERRFYNWSEGTHAILCQA